MLRLSQPACTFSFCLLACIYFARWRISFCLSVCSSKGLFSSQALSMSSITLLFPFWIIWKDFWYFSPPVISGCCRETAETILELPESYSEPLCSLHPDFPPHFCVIFLLFSLPFFLILPSLFVPLRLSSTLVLYELFLSKLQILSL